MIAACERTIEYVAQATTTFRTFDVVVGDDAMVIDALTEHPGADRLRYARRVRGVRR